jgi:hypothetical protein
MTSVNYIDRPICSECVDATSEVAISRLRRDNARPSRIAGHCWVRAMPRYRVRRKPPTIFVLSIRSRRVFRNPLRSPCYLHCWRQVVSSKLPLHGPYPLHVAPFCLPANTSRRRPILICGNAKSDGRAFSESVPPDSGRSPGSIGHSRRTRC